LSAPLTDLVGSKGGSAVDAGSTVVAEAESASEQATAAVADAVEEGSAVVADAADAVEEAAETAEEAPEEQAPEESEPAAKSRKSRKTEDYEGWTKPQLQEELVKRGLPKSGNVPDLRERLRAAD